MTITATFHLFPQLPPELRNRVWELSAEPRIVKVNVVTQDAYHTFVPDPTRSPREGNRPVRHPGFRFLRSPTPAPAQLHTCRESREHLSRHPYEGYQKAFSSIAQTPSLGFDAVPEGGPEWGRYVWLNFDLDIVSLTKLYMMRHFDAFAWQIKRLRFEDFVYHNENDYYNVDHIYSAYKNLTELYFVCSDGIRNAHRMAQDTFFGHNVSVYLVDPEHLGGKIMSALELDTMMDAEEEEAWKEIGGRPASELDDSELRGSEGI